MYFTRLLILLSVLFLFGFTIEYSPFSYFESNDKGFIKDEVIATLREGRITGIVSNDDYVFVKYLDVDRTVIEIYDHEFNLLSDENEFVGLNSVYEEKGEMYVLVRESMGGFENRVALYKLDDNLQFKKEFELIGELGSDISIPVLIDEEYHMIISEKIDAPETTRGYTFEKTLNKITANTLETADHEDGILYQSDNTIYIAKDDFIYSVTNHKFDDSFTNNQMIGTYEDITHFRHFTSYKNGLFVDSYSDVDGNYYYRLVEFDESSFTFETQTEKLEVLPYSHVGSYLQETNLFIQDGDIVKMMNTSGTPSEYQKIVTYIEFNTKTGDYTKYDTLEELVLIQDELYELVDHQLYLLSDEYIAFDTEDDLSFNISLSFLLFGSILFTSLKNQKLVFKGGEQHV